VKIAVAQKKYVLVVNEGFRKYINLNADEKSYQHSN